VCGGIDRLGDTRGLGKTVEECQRSTKIKQADVPPTFEDLARLKSPPGLWASEALKL
jgi:hypothetical protein